MPEWYWVAPAALTAALLLDEIITEWEDREMGRRPQAKPYKPYRRTIHRVQLDVSFSDDGLYDVRALKWDNGRPTMVQLDRGMYLDLSDRYAVALLKNALDDAHARVERGESLLSL